MDKNNNIASNFNSKYEDIKKKVKNQYYPSDKKFINETESEYVPLSKYNNENIPKYDNVLILKRKNLGGDFAAWAYGLNKINIKLYDIFIFINDTVCGPFIPRYIPKLFKLSNDFFSLFL